MKKFIMSCVLALSANAFAANQPSQLDDLIRGEMAAVKTYDTALEKVQDPKEIEKLQTIRQNHVTAVEKLKTYATKDVKEDTKSAGAWGAFATAYTGGARLFGDKTAVKALTQGEQHGIDEYKEALEDKNINPELKKMIRTQFLPKQQEHIKSLRTLM